MSAAEKSSGDMQWTPFVVVAAVDFSAASGHAVRHALQLARQYQDSEVHMVHVVEKDPNAVSSTTRIEKLDATLDQAPEKVREFVAEQGHLSDPDLDGTPVGVHVRIGDPVEELLQLTADVAADLLIVGNHGKSGLQRFFLGSVSEKVARLAHCPVLVARPIDYSGIETTETVEVERPCPKCIETRRESEGATWWCADHARPREAHYYSSTSVVQWATHNSDVSPTGIR